MRTVRRERVAPDGTGEQLCQSGPGGERGNRRIPGKEQKMGPAEKVGFVPLCASKAAHGQTHSVA